jgi:hypothetical protein
MIEIAGQEWVTATEAAHDLHVPVDRVYDWRRRALVTPVTLPNGRTMYRLADLWDVERGTRLSGPRGR